MFCVSLGNDQSAQLADSGGKSWSCLWLYGAEPSALPVVYFSTQLRLLPPPPSSVPPPLKPVSMMFGNRGTGLKWFKASKTTAEGRDQRRGAGVLVPQCQFNGAHQKVNMRLVSKWEKPEFGLARVSLRRGWRSICFGCSGGLECNTAKQRWGLLYGFVCIFIKKKKGLPVYRTHIIPSC